MPKIKKLIAIKYLRFDSFVIYNNNDNNNNIYLFVQQVDPITGQNTKTLLKLNYTGVYIKRRDKLQHERAKID